MVESNTSKENFLVQHTDFSLREQVKYPNGGLSSFYDNGTDMVIIDEDICVHNPEEPVFSYMLITDKQNNYMHQFKRVFRFLGYVQSEVERYLSKDEITMPMDYMITVGDRGEQADASPLELHFEQSFTNAYGINALKFLSREYGICDENGKNYFLDYLVRTRNGKYAVEENGVTYHHPQIIGEEKYKYQLRKQNTCALWGIKLFRFSTEDCAFENRIEDDIKQYFGKDTSEFVDDGLKIDRKVELYEHQTVSLQEIQKRREAGIKAFLIVLPTAAGKSKIVEEDLREFAKSRQDFKGLILVPGVNILADWEDRIRTSLPELKDKIEIKTYAYMARHYADVQPDYYNYLVVDEAHHAVAPVLKRVIQYFNTEFTIGLTATDQRPDKKKLETVFGTYSTSLSLKEAMEKEVVAKANVYRIETNIDLSQVRFNGKDYVNADLEKRVRVTSRNELIVNVLEEYFTSGEAGLRQGVIFCVNVNHANEMAKLLNNAGMTAASYTGQTKNSTELMEDFKQKRIRFLCACNMISEGWDYGCVDDELIIDLAKRYKISAPADLADEYEEELCPDAGTPISWSRFYDAFYDWKPEYAKARLQALMDFGSDDEVLEVIQELFWDDEYEASRFVTRALDAGVRFRDENLVELAGLCNEDTVNQAVYLSKLLLTEKSLEELYGNISDDIIIQIAKEQNLRLPEDLR